MITTIKALVVSDSGVKTFTTAKNEEIKYRQIFVMDHQDTEPVPISVPVDLKVDMHSEVKVNINIKRQNGKIKLVLVQ